MKRVSNILAIVCLLAISVGPAPIARNAFADDACKHDGSLCGMLKLLPDLLGDPSGAYDRLVYDNYAEHLQHFGFTTPTSFDGEGWENFKAISYDLVGAGAYLQYVNFWEERMGYSPFLIDQVIEYGTEPDSLTLLRGRFEQSSVESSWEQIGYTPTTINGTVVWKLRGDYEHDVMVRPLRDSARYNYATFVQDDVIAYSSTAMGIQATIQASGGSAPALAENVTVVQLLANVPSELASAALGPGEDFGSSSTWLLFGIIPGGPGRTDPRTGEPGPIPADAPLKQAHAALLYGPDVDLEQTANVISSTFLSGDVARAKQPYTDFFQDLNVAVDASNPVVAVQYTPNIDTPSNLFSFLRAHDLGFLI
jgi:hypothetical protein